MGLLDVTTIAVELRQEHGFVLLALLLTVFLHFWYMPAKVAAARRRFGVKYPALYADSSNPKANDFNCVQRGHQNSLEQLPHFLSMFAAAALRNPIWAAVAGLTFNVGRFLYFQGYSTGVPSNRNRGGPLAILATFSLYIPVVLFANSLLKLSKA